MSETSSRQITYQANWGGGFNEGLQSDFWMTRTSILLVNRGFFPVAPQGTINPSD